MVRCAARSEKPMGTERAMGSPVSEPALRRLRAAPLEPEPRSPPGLWQFDRERDEFASRSTRQQIVCATTAARTVAAG